MRAGASTTWASALQRVWLNRGPWARALWPVAALYGALTALRRMLYRTGWLRATELPVPVVVIGNLIAGGAGKTPTVMAVVQLLRARGHVPGIVSRGHGRRDAGCVLVQRTTPAEQCGDEPLLLHLRTGAPVCVGRDRVAAAGLLLAQHPQVDVIVSDDGLQHLALARIAQVLVFDARGAGNGWLLPAGPLRERLPVHVPPRTVVLYNAPSASTPLPGTLAHAQLAGVVPLAAWWSGEPASMRALGSLCERADAGGARVVAAAGLAHPQRFFSMLGEAGLRIAPLPLPDHYPYPAGTALPWPADTADVVVTEKDAVKLAPAAMGATRVWVATLDFRPDAAFDAALLALLPAPTADITTIPATATATATGEAHGNAPA